MTTSFEQIAEDLRTRIASGALAAGDRVPSENTVAADWGVSRNTARQAILSLVNQGVLESRGRVQGYVVKQFRRLPWYASTNENRTHRDGAHRDIFQTEIRKLGLTPSARLEVTPAEAPPREVAELLQVTADTQVTKRWRLQYVDGEPFAISTAFFPPWVVAELPELGEQRDLQPGAVAVLAESRYAPVDAPADEWITQMPLPEIASVLQMGPGVPLMTGYRTSYDAEGNPCRVTVTELPGDRWKVIY